MYPITPEKNPYAAVREDKWEEDINGVHFVRSKSYDDMGRVLGISTEKFRDGVLIGHVAQYVEADGWWHGGAYDSGIGSGCQILRPFIEGEFM